MKRKRLLWQLYPTQLAILLTALLAIVLYGSKSIRDFYFEQVAADLNARARLIEGQVKQLFTEGKTGEIDALINKVGRESLTRITVINRAGLVLSDSEEDPARMDNHSDRPEVIAALAGRTEPALRYSYTLKENMMYVAIPIANGSGIAGVVRTAIPVTSIDKALRDIQLKIACGGVIVAILSALVIWMLTRRISRPLVEMKQGAENFAKGDFSRKLVSSGSEEIGSLAEAMNQMAAQLDDRFRTIVKQRNQLEAVFSSMVEGVFTVDLDERFTSINQAGADFIGVDKKNALGRSALAVAQNKELQDFIHKTLSSAQPVEGEIILPAATGERFFHAHGVRLRDDRCRHTGGLIVLNDVTNLRRLESVRRDFVANVSHELKTPITSIKGFVETLQEGAIGEPEQARKFLGIIAAQTSRLEAIIEDLLELSRIEQEAEQTEIILSENSLKKSLEAVVEICQMKAEEKGISLVSRCPEGLTARINPALFEQAVANLVDNAIKYSPAESSIAVSAETLGSDIAVAVRDTGAGIAKEHQDRLFERFYRIDKARSKKLGGTGLGLAIVKHIVLAHHGRIEVTSRPGKGSTFTIILPRNSGG